jgi:hypothetical protein
MNYFIKDLGHENGCFMKLENEFQLNDHTMINIGQSFLLIFLKPEDKSSITIKLFHGTLREEYNFDAGVVNNKVTIGRDYNCDLVIEDSFLSKIHCTILFENMQWFVMNGEKINFSSLDISTRNDSTNGTWIYLAEDEEIFDGMVIKSGKTKFEVKYLKINYLSAKLFKYVYRSNIFKLYLIILFLLVINKVGYLYK